MSRRQSMGLSHAYAHHMRVQNPQLMSSPMKRQNMKYQTAAIKRANNPFYVGVQTKLDSVKRQLSQSPKRKSPKRKPKKKVTFQKRRRR